jgi:hypothetical protein
VNVSSDTLVLLRAFATAVEANKGVPSDSDERLLDAEGLALKRFFHAVSSLYLQRSTTVPELGASFFDPASMNVLARATIESFLVFHYVFIQPQGESERELRHLSWVLADLMARQELPATLPENQVKQREELEQIKVLKRRIRQNWEFTQLPPKQQKAVLEKKLWRFASWTEIARQAGFSQLHAEHAYRLLCSYAHSGSLSVLQVRQANAKEDQQFLAESALRLVNVGVAFMTNAYSSMFESAKRALDANPPLKDKVDEWAWLGAAV